MIITARILDVLKAFSKINMSLYMEKNGVLATKNLNGGVYAKVNFPVQIDNDYGIYDLPEFIDRCYSGSELQINGTDITIDRSTTAKLHSADKSVIVSPKPIEMKLFENISPSIFEMNINGALVKEIKKHKHHNLVISASANTVRATIVDYGLRNEVMRLAEAPRTTPDFSVNVSTNNLMHLPSEDTRVRITKVGVILFESKNIQSMVIAQACKHPYL
ncbi:hypothetical protein E2R68_02325 [Psychromonas sp. RZ22]|uniref:hypothetical protein n=1 Tax=Psychromonas algarum TaxID=2555643 RepID=UPI001067CEE2|nr:hypothetical protein [Psychromonas sp. RZ22]TEW55948.1 hypothetical protein E2R68_02325 [Psychromonas sp. RZ22]